MPVSTYSRYHGLETVSVRGQVSLAQRLLRPDEPPAGSVRHTIVGNETLDQLAFTYYGREDLWWRIADANPGKFPLDWQPGDTLLVPPLSVATRTPRR